MVNEPDKLYHYPLDHMNAVKDTLNEFNTLYSIITVPPGAKKSNGTVREWKSKALRRDLEPGSYQIKVLSYTSDD